MQAALDIKQHGLLAGLDQDDHEQYLRIDGYRAMTGTLHTQAILPTYDKVYDIGLLTTKRFRRIAANQLTNIIESGPLPLVPAILNIQDPAYGGLVNVRTWGAGTNVVTLNGPQGASMVSGNIFSSGGGTSTLRASADAANVMGMGRAFGSSAVMTIEATGRSALAGGYISGYGSARIAAAHNGSLAWGSALTFDVLGDVSIFAEDRGSVALGYVFGYPGVATIYAGGRGAMAQGHVYCDVASSTQTGIHARNNGSFAHGSAVCRGGTHTGVYIKSSAIGSNASGYVYNSSGAVGSRVLTLGRGSMAHGYARNGEAIEALANNSFQFGPGSNSLQESLQVGLAGLRFKGDAGAPTTPQNGDHWVSGGYVYIQSNGVPVKIV